MGEIRLSVGQVNITQYLIVNVREVGNPSVVVDNLVVPPPVPSVQNLLFSGLNDVVHFVDFRESADGIDQGLLLATYVYDVQTQTLMAERRFYQAGGPGEHDPAPGSSEIIDPYFIDKNIYGVFKEGARYLKPTDEWTVTGDTISFLAYGDFGDGENISVEINYLLSSSGQNQRGFPSDIIEVFADTALDATYYGKMIEARGSTDILVMSTPDVSVIPDLKIIGINCDNGDQRYVKLNIFGGYLLVNGFLRETVYIGKGEELTMIKKGAYFRVVSWTPGTHARVGERVMSEKAQSNALPETGGWYNISEYPRLYEWYINELDPSVLGTGTSPGTPTAANATKWCIDAVNGMFWVPDTGGYFLRMTDVDGNIDTQRSVGDRKPGTIQGDGLKASDITIEGMSRRGNPNGNGDRTTNNNYFIDKFRDPTNLLPLTLTSTSNETRPKNVNTNSYRIF